MLYDCSEFCERIILCNSLIWSCSITGRTNMTFEEALQCEENAKRSLKEFPMEVTTFDQSPAMLRIEISNSLIIYVVYYSCVYLYCTLLVKRTGRPLKK